MNNSVSVATQTRADCSAHTTHSAQQVGPLVNTTIHLPQHKHAWDGGGGAGRRIENRGWGIASGGFAMCGLMWYILTSTQPTHLQLSEARWGSQWWKFRTAIWT